MEKRITVMGIVAALVFIAAFAQSANAAEFSTIDIAISSGKIVVNDVFDNDDSIEVVDVFVRTGNSITQHTFNDVAGGAELDAAFVPSSTVYYNFMDSDGTIVNVGYLRYLQSPMPPAPPDNDIANTWIVESYEMTPRKAQDNRNYYIDFVFDLNKQISVTKADLTWGLGESQVALNKTTPAVFDATANKWKVTIGPFVGKITLRSNLRVVMPNSKLAYFYMGYVGYQLLVSDESACNAQTNVVVSTAGSDALRQENALYFSPAEPESSGVMDAGIASGAQVVDEGIVPGNDFAEQSGIGTAYFQARTFTGFSYLKIVDDNGVIVASGVFDNDDSIGRADVFVVDGTNATQYTFTNLTEGMELNVEVPSGATAYYNYTDTDGSVSNVSVNNIIGDGSLLPPPPEKPPSRVDSFSVSAVPNDGYTSYALEFTVKTNDIDYKINKVYAEYREVGTNIWTRIVLQKNGAEWTGTSAAFDDERFMNVRVRAFDETLGAGLVAKYPRWFDIVPPSQVLCIEICGNKTDDDNDKLIDEGCVLLPDLVFTSTENIPHFVIIGNQIKVPFTIKNAGVSDSDGFEVALLMNDEVVETISSPPLKADESAELEFAIDDSSQFAGANLLAISLDYGNVVPEINELNNSFTKDIGVGYNGLILILNSNQANLLGDTREIKAIDRFGFPVAGVKVSVALPSGNVVDALSGSNGVAGFTLSEPGNYLVNAEKSEYTPYSGSFEVAPIVISGIGSVVNVGQTIDFNVQTSTGQPVTDAKIEFEYPTGERTGVSLNNLGQGQIRPTIAGGHKIIVSRNGIKIYESGFVVAGIVESFFVGGSSPVELLFGSIVRSPIPFLLLLIASFMAAALAYTRSRLLFRAGAKSTREKQTETAIRIGVGVLFFILPFQVERLFGLQAGVAAIIVEIVVVLVFYYYAKNLRKRKAIEIR